MHISIELIILIVALTAAFFLFALTIGIHAQRKKVVTGNEGIVGEKGITLSILDPLGQVKVHGEIWQAESIDGKIDKSGHVIITGIENLTLKVKKEP